MKSALDVYKERGGDEDTPAIEPRQLSYARLAEIERQALTDDTPAGAVLRELLGHAAHFETIGVGSYYVSFTEAADRDESERREREGLEDPAQAYVDHLADQAVADQFELDGADHDGPEDYL